MTIHTLFKTYCRQLKFLRLAGLVGALVLSLVFSFQSTPSLAQPEGLGARVIARYPLATTRLGTMQARALPDWVGDDRGLNVGGIFSGLYHVLGDEEHIFYALSDRGPNGKVRVENEQRRTFPVPEYNPVVYKLLAGKQLHILAETPIRTRSNQPVTGLPNTSNDEIPYTYDGQTRLPLNPNGLDPEGLARAPDGTFWLGEEYSPSVVQLAANGTVVHRLIPAGITLAADTDVRPVLPAIYAKRRLNRGFEGLTISEDGKNVFVALQSPLDFPSKGIGRASQMVRLLVVDTQQLVPVAEYVYVAELASSFGATKQGEMKIGDLTFLNPTTLLVVERTDKVAHIYQVDLSQATNILGTRWSDLQNTTSALEALAPQQLGVNGITPVTKNLLVDLSRVPQIPEKIEGLTMVNPSTLAIGNDNDFGFDSFDAQGRAINNNLPSELLILHLSMPLPLNQVTPVSVNAATPLSR